MAKVMKVEITQETFGTIVENGFETQVIKYTMNGLLNGRPAISASVSSLGATLVTLSVPDRNGKMDDINLGFDTLQEYEDQDSYMGTTIGRNASRVGDSQFTLNGKTYKLPKNTPGGHLHGGIRGFDKRLWSSEVGEDSVTFSRISTDGEEGYPNSVLAQITYRLTVFNDNAALSLEYKGLSMASTPLNMTNHAYFNLAGHDKGPEELSNHQLSIQADRKLLLEGGIAKGSVVSLDEGSLDGSVAQLMAQFGGEIDDVLLLSEPPPDDGLRLACVISHGLTGRLLRVSTNQLALVVYTANHFPAAPDGYRGKGGATYSRHGSIALETSGYPNAMNVPSFPSVTLRSGEVYNHRTVLEFSTFYQEAASTCTST